MGASLALAALTPFGAAAATAPSGDAVGSPPPGLGIVLLDVPVERADDPRANAYVVDHAIPGATLVRHARVSNGSDETLPVDLRGVPASAAGGWVVDDGLTGVAGSLATWIEVEPAQLVLGPGASEEITITIAVPAGAPDGEHYAAVVATPPGVDAGGGVEVVNRVGLRVYLSVGSGDEPVTDFEVDTLTAGRDDAGLPTVTVGVANTGGRAIDVAGELTLVSADGVLSSGPFLTVLPATIGPAERGAVEVVLDADLPDGPWNATVTLRSGLVERMAEATITFPTAAGDMADPVAALRVEAQKRVLVPFAVLLLLAAGAGAGWMLRQRRREAAQAAAAEATAGPPQPLSAGVGGRR